MKNQTSLYLVLGLVILAGIGMAVKFFSNPIGSLQTILVILIVGAVIYFLVKHFKKANPQKREQDAFRRAAKLSKKKYQQDALKGSRFNKLGNITSVKKPKKKVRSSSHLRVIEGRKGKKRNRASL